MRCVDLQHLALDNSIPAGTGRTDKLTLVSDNRLEIPGLKQRPLGERRRSVKACHTRSIRLFNSKSRETSRSGLLLLQQLSQPVDPLGPKALVI